MKLDDNILLYIASKLKSNIRELEGFLKRINAYASLTHQDVDMNLVKNLMNELLPAEEQDEEPVDDPADEVPDGSQRARGRGRRRGERPTTSGA